MKKQSTRRQQPRRSRSLTLPELLQGVIIPALLAATVGFAVKDSLHSKTRLQSLAALVLAIPVGFIVCVWQGWIQP
jgi:hypothetical protein